MLNKNVLLFSSIIASMLIFGCNEMNDELSDARTAQNSNLDWSYSYALENYEKLLNEVINKSGLVDYRLLMTEPHLSTLNNLQLFYQEFYATRLEGEVKLSFWLNAYNIYVLYHVVRYLQLPKYKTEVFSVINSGNFFSRPWCHFKDLSLSLDEIEKVILLKYFKRPEIHFGLVCASLGCPKSLTVYHPETVNEQLNSAGTKFISSDLIIDHENQNIFVSEIFDWYSKDFQPSNGSTLEKINPWLSSNLRAKLAISDYQVTFKDYDWTLNQSSELYR